MLDLIKDAAYVSDEVAASVLAAQINSGNVADDVQYIDMTNGGASFELGTSHAADYEYIYVVDKYNELIMAFKVFANVD